MVGSEETGRAPLTSKSTGQASPLKPRKRRVRILVASVFAACVAIVSAGLVATASHADEGSVVRVIDGDTVDIRIGGKVERVRLLNVDAPEDNRVSGESECLGPQATAMLARLLPEGARVTLEYDKERRDRYDRLLAGIFYSDGDLVNAKMAEAGLAGPLVVGGNDRFSAKVTQAFEAARSSQVGAFDSSVECTPGAIVESYRQRTNQAVTGSQPTGAAGLAAVAASSSALGEAGDVALVKIEASGWMGDALVAQSIHDVETLQGQLADFEVAIEAAHKQAVAEEARIVEEQRIAEEKAAREQAAREQAAREQAAREQAARESAERARAESRSNTNEAAPKQATPTKPNDGGGSTYTGCRNYNGTGMIDTKGRPFAPIPCP